MDDNVRIGLSERWWIRWRRVEPIKAALEKAFLDHWSQAIRQALVLQSRDWADLVEQLREGPQPASLTDLSTPLGQLAVADCLGSELGQLYPSRVDWLASAVWELGEGRLGRTEAKAYVLYRLSASAEALRNGEPAWDEQALRLVRDTLSDVWRRSDDTREVIASAAARMGDLIGKLDGP